MLNFISSLHLLTFLRKHYGILPPPFLFLLIIIWHKDWGNYLPIMGTLIWEQKQVSFYNGWFFLWQMGFSFAGKAVYTAVWVAAVSLFMELLGFSTQKWLTAGGLGTVLLTLAGREVQLYFLSFSPLKSLQFLVSSTLYILVGTCKSSTRPTFFLAFCCQGKRSFMQSLNHILMCSDIYQFPFKCNDSYNAAICCEWMDSNKHWRLWSFWHSWGLY